MRQVRSTRSTVHTAYGVRSTSTSFFFFFFPPENGSPNQCWRAEVTYLGTEYLLRTVDGFIPNLPMTNLPAVTAGGEEEYSRVDGYTQVG